MEGHTSGGRPCDQEHLNLGTSRSGMAALLKAMQ